MYKTKYSLYMQVCIIFILFFSAHRALAGTDSNSSQISDLIESREQISVQIDGNSLNLRKNIKLSDVFEALGDPEDIEYVHSGFFLYCWGLSSEESPSIIIDASPTKNNVEDWMSVWFKNDKPVRIAACSIPGDSRFQLLGCIQYIRQSYKIRPAICPKGLWCRTVNLEQNGSKFEILSEFDVVGPSVSISVFNTGLQPIEIPDNLEKYVSLIIETPNKKTFISRNPKIKKPFDIFDPGQFIPLNVSFFSWVNDVNNNQDVPIGVYKYYATFLGARSRTAKANVHRKAFILPNPNSPDEEIVITPHYDKLPIHRLKYNELVEACTAAFKSPFKGDPCDVQIPVYEFGGLSKSIPLPGGGHADAARLEKKYYPLREFAFVEIRKRQ